jgi:hypothetical protein
MTEKENKVTKTIGQAIDEIVEALKSLDQNSRITAIWATCEHLKIPLLEKTKGESEDRVLQHSEVSIKPTLVDIKSFKEQKKPTSANEMSAVIAFYLSELAPSEDRKTEVEIDEMVKYFKQSGFPLPRVPKVLLQNARNAGYFDFVGGGKFKLNPVGYNLVAHNLPRTGTTIAIKPVKSRKMARKPKQTGRTKNKTK